MNIILYAYNNPSKALLEIMCQGKVDLSYVLYLLYEVGVTGILQFIEFFVLSLLLLGFSPALIKEPLKNPTKQK